MRLSALILVAILLSVLVLPVMLDVDPMRTNTSAQLQPPGPEHLLGTDLLGRDVFSRTVYGGRQTLLSAVLATTLTATLGLPLGLITAIGHPAVDRAGMIGINAMLAVPSLLTAMVVITLLGRGLGSLVVAVGLSQVALLATMTRAAVMAIRAAGYIDAAVNLGASRRHILMEHILPNIQPTVLAYLGVLFSYALLNGAALGFLGLGGELAAPEWGIMLAEGRAAFRSAPWISAAPGVMISLTVWAVNNLVDYRVRGQV